MESANLALQSFKPKRIFSLRVTTWNINSVRLRIGLFKDIAENLVPDVICLQETKSPDEHFPLLAFREFGYDHAAIFGQKSYNGVAILSKRPIEHVRKMHWCGRDDCRHIIARIDGLDIHSLYIPAGGDIPDPEINEKFAHKLAFLDETTNWFASMVNDGQPAVLTGDFNIAPLETDVWSHKQLLGVVSHTPIEVERLARLQASKPWVDAVRAIIPPDQKLYSWWSYRSSDWKKNDRGRRLDHIWITPDLLPRLRSAEILKDARDWASPSDHTPVTIDLA